MKGFFLLNECGCVGMRAVGISTDCRQQFVYFTDTSGKTIQRMKYDGSEQKIILSGNNKELKFSVINCWFLELGSPEGIAIDWVSRLVFWTDSSLKRLEVAKLDGSLRKVLLDKNIQNPRGIAVNPELGFVLQYDSTSK
jgi:sugar lactone lactonase YvrE